MIQIYIIFANQLFQIRNYFCAHHFFLTFPLRFSTRFSLSLFHCGMPHQSPDDRVEDVAFSHPDPGNIWAWSSGVSRWVHSNLVIRILPKINTRVVTTFVTPEWGSPYHHPLISMEALSWLDSTMIMSPNHALPIASYFDPIVVSDSDRCSILVWLVSSD